VVKRVTYDREQHSAALDGECNTQELLRMLAEIDQDPECAQADSVYRLIGDTLRDPDSPVLGTNVTSAVMRSVARESVPHVPADAVVKPFQSGRRIATERQSVFWRGLRSSAAMVAAVGVISALVWKSSAVNPDPVVAYVIFEQPRSQPQVVQMDSMPPDLVDYLLAHRQNSVAGSMNAGSAVIRANMGEAGVSTDRNGTATPRAGEMDWVRLWDSRPVYVTPRTVER